MNDRAAALAAIALAALTACANSKSSSAASPQPGGAAPAVSAGTNCNGEAPVWAMERPKVYVLSGERLYGKTKVGKYLCLSDAQAEGYQPARHPFRRRSKEAPSS
jgi:hypothetical protein